MLQRQWLLRRRTPCQPCRSYPHYLRATRGRGRQVSQSSRSCCILPAPHRTSAARWDAALRAVCGQSEGRRHAHKHRDKCSFPGVGCGTHHVSVDTLYILMKLLRQGRLLHLLLLHGAQNVIVLLQSPPLWANLQSQQRHKSQTGFLPSSSYTCRLSQMHENPGEQSMPGYTALIASQHSLATF